MIFEVTAKMTAELGKFSDGFASFRKMLAAVPQTARLKIFMSAAKEAAGYVSKGLDRAIAADELTDMAIANGLDDPDAVQFIISEAFKNIEEPEHVPDDDDFGLNGNGKGNGHGLRPKEEPPPLLPLINIRLWQGVEPKPRQWIVHERIPDHNVTLLTGHGGVGKTLLMQQLSAATVLGRDWIGELPEPGPVLFITAEDDEDELHFRYNKIAKFYDVSFDQLADNGLHLMSLAGKDATMAVADSKGIVKPTDLFHTMVRTIREIRPRWVGIDTTADIFVVNERERTEVRQCISLMRGIALSIGTAVILLSHPSLTGISTGTGLSGSTAWNNSVRSRLYLKVEKASKEDEQADDDEIDHSSPRILEFMKSNYSALAAPVKLKWKDGLLLPEQHTTKSAFEVAAAEERARTIFLKLIERYNRQDQAVSPNPNARNYAPLEFARQAEAKELHRKEDRRKGLMRMAMDWAFANDKVELGKGPRSLVASRQFQCIYRTGILL
jgi:RecA-family ATPase